MSLLRGGVLCLVLVCAFPHPGAAQQRHTVGPDVAAALMADPAARRLDDGTVFIRRRPAATRFAGLCSQEALYLSPGPATAEREIQTEITFRTLRDPRAAAGEDRGQLHKACEDASQVAVKAPDERSAWLGAYAVELVRDELGKPQSAVLIRRCVESSLCQDDRLALEIIKRDQIIAVQPIDCAGRAEVCLHITGFFDANASKIRGPSVAMDLRVEMAGRADGTWSLRAASLDEVLLEATDD